MTNTFTCPEGPQPGGPDLVVDKDVEVVVCPAPADPNLQCCYNVRATVTNIGNELAGGSDTCIYIGGVHDPGNDAGTGRLGPGASVVQNFGPFECLCSDDLINVTVCADNYNVVAESNETNNCETNFVDNRVGDIEVTKEVWDGAAWVDEIFGAEYCVQVEFRSTVHNSGCCCDLTDIPVTDVLSCSLEYLDVLGDTPEPDERIDHADGRTELRWFIQDPLEPCEELEYFILAHVIGCGEDTNTQTATATTCTGDVVTDSDIATVNAPQQAKIEVIKEVEDPVTGDWVHDITVPAGTRVHFSSVVHNDGTCCDLTSIEVWDELSASLQDIDVVDGPQPTMIYAGPGGSTILYWSLPQVTLEPCEELVFLIDATAVGAPGDIDTNTQRARGYSAETDEYVTDEDDALVRIAVPPPPPVARISVTKTANPTEGEPCTDVDFTITVTNTGDFPLNPVRVVDVLPAGMTYVSSSHGGVHGPPAGTIRWDIPGGMDVGETITIRLTAHIDDGPAGPLVNRVGVTGTPPLGDPDVRDDDTARVTRRTASIDVEKTADPDFGHPSTNVDFTITVTNNGNIALDPVIVVDTLPWELFGFKMSYVLDDSGGSWNALTREVSWNLGTMQPGQVIIIHLVAHIDNNGAGDNYVYVGGTSPAGYYVDDDDTARVRSPC
jgi:uncharacterized repeat protein (TIGR01451 family)